MCVRDSFKADNFDASLAEGVDTFSWQPNFTAAANEDFKGYNALFKAFCGARYGAGTDLPTIDDGVRAMQVLAAMLEGIARPAVNIPVQQQD